jgi:hypothetical protein
VLRITPQGNATLFVVGEMHPPLINPSRSSGLTARRVVLFIPEVPCAGRLLKPTTVTAIVITSR